MLRLNANDKRYFHLPNLNTDFYFHIKQRFKGYLK
nr:MAG TPA: hypothetical protein [Caudoviricetes sp.]